MSAGECTAGDLDVGLDAGLSFSFSVAAEPVEHHVGAGLGQRVGDAKPMPQVDPVTTAVLPLNVPIGFTPALAPVILGTSPVRS